MFGGFVLLIESYLSRLTLASYRPATVDLRRRVLVNFAATLAPRELADASRHDCEQFLARPLAPGSRRVYRSTLRHFYGWAVDEGLLGENPAGRIPPIRVRAGTPRPVSEPDLRRALARADTRTRAWLLLMSLAGLRCLEVAALRPRDLVSTDGGWLLMLVETKGGAPAVVPAHPAVVSGLSMLPVSAGMWWSCSSRHVGRVVAGHLRSCGVDATAHQLRHTAATAWLRASDHDLLTTATLMRHRSVQTTQVYAQLDPQRPAQVVSLVDLGTGTG